MFEANFEASLGELAQRSIAEGVVPGFAVSVGYFGETVFEGAYGSRRILPEVVSNSVDTIYDCASLTKVVVTATCLMLLNDQSPFEWEAPASQYLPELDHLPQVPTLLQLATHFSGFPPSVDLTEDWMGAEEGYLRACHTPLQAAPGQQFCYSDINFILLGKLVERLTGQRLHEFAQEAIFAPLGMRDSSFSPGAIPRVAPTEGTLTGEVHDPAARRMGGAAGHAGLFSTARDLSKFCRELMRGALAPNQVEFFTMNHAPCGNSVKRGIGWDIDSQYSSNRGDLFPIGGYGHTGFTGTSIWIDPESQTFAIFLSNAIHPVVPETPAKRNALRREFANLVAREVGYGN